MPSGLVSPLRAGMSPLSPHPPVAIAFVMTKRMVADALRTRAELSVAQWSGGLEEPVDDLGEFS